MKRKKEIYFKKLAYVIVEANKSKICRAGLQAGGPRRSYCYSSSWKAVWRQSLSSEIGEAHPCY